MAIEIVTVQFNLPGRPNYKTLLDVFKYSLKKHMPNVKLIEHRIQGPPKPKERPWNFLYNTLKLEIWKDHLNNTNNNVIFADCDMLAVRSAEHAFNLPFDVAYTARTVLVRIPMNGGIMFARPTAKAREFFKQMYDINVRMYNNPKFHQHWRERYAGMNQSAFGYTLEKGTHKAKILKLITREWNAVDCDWAHINKKTVFIHYKSKLRKLVLRNAPLQGGYQKAQKIWYDMKNEMDRAIRKKHRRKSK